MDIIIGSDHRGVELKEKVKQYLKEQKFFTVDVGTNDAKKAVDFPLVVKEAVECILGANHFGGILICGKGVGMCIAANRYPGIRAVLCHTPEAAKDARQRNDMNVLCLGAYDQSDFENVKKILYAFTHTLFDGEERHKRRNHMLDEFLNKRIV